MGCKSAARYLVSTAFAMQVSGALAEGTDAETAALNVEMGSLAVPNSAQHAAETALASLEARGLSPNGIRPKCRNFHGIANAMSASWS